MTSILAPASSTNDAPICVTTKIRWRPLLPVIRTLPLERCTCTRRVGGQARDKGQNHCGDNGERPAHPEQAGIDGKIERANRETRRVTSENLNHPLRAPHAERRTGPAEQKAFGQQHAAERASARAECGADRQLAFAANGARQDVVRDIGTRDDEDQSGRCEQNEQHGPGARGDLVAKQLGRDLKVSPLRVSLRVVFFHRRVHGAQFDASLLEGGSGSETRKELRHAMRRSVTMVAER